MKREIVEEVYMLTFTCGDSKPHVLGLLPEAVPPFKAWLAERITFDAMMTTFHEIVSKIYGRMLTEPFVDAMQQVNTLCFPGA